MRRSTNTSCASDAGRSWRWTCNSSSRSPTSCASGTGSTRTSRTSPSSASVAPVERRSGPAGSAGDRARIDPVKHVDGPAQRAEHHAHVFEHEAEIRVAGARRVTWQLVVPQLVDVAGTGLSSDDLQHGGWIDFRAENGRHLVGTDLVHEDGHLTGRTLREVAGLDGA